MSTLFDEIKEVSQYIELVDEERKSKMSFALFNKKSNVWGKLSDKEKIQFYERFDLPEKMHARIYLAWLLVANEIVTETKNNKEVPSTVIDWFRDN